MLQQPLNMILVGRSVFILERVLFKQSLESITLSVIRIELENGCQFIMVKILKDSLLVSINDCVIDSAFENLSSIDVLFYCSTTDESVNNDISPLTNTINSVYALVVISRIPIWVKNDCSVSTN